MPYKSQLDPSQFRQSDAGERLYTVRQSNSNWTKTVPVDVTLSVAGTAQNLYSISQNIPTTNLITNPSMETGAPPTSWVAVGSTLSQSALQARSGTNSLLVNPDNSATGEGAYFALGNYPGGLPLACSAHIRGVGAGNDARVEIRRVDTGAVISTGGTITLQSDNWNDRSTAILSVNTLPAKVAVDIRLYVVTVTQHTSDFYVDDAQAESHSIATAYADGAVGLNNYWLGTANASESQRTRTVGLITGYRLHTTRDIYINVDDLDASSTTGEYIRAGTDFNAVHSLAITDRISFVNVNAGETPRIYGALYGYPDVEGS